MSSEETNKRLAEERAQIVAVWDRERPSAPPIIMELVDGLMKIVKDQPTIEAMILAASAVNGRLSIPQQWVR